jgi:hypothetical protein
LGHIYNMKNQFWAGLGSWAVLVKKKFGADYEQLLRPIFLCFNGQKMILKIWEVFFTGEIPVFLGLKISM